MVDGGSNKIARVYIAPLTVEDLDRILADNDKIIVRGIKHGIVESTI